MSQYTSNTTIQNDPKNGQGTWTDSSQKKTYKWIRYITKDQHQWSLGENKLKSQYDIISPSSNEIFKQWKINWELCCEWHVTGAQKYIH
jgi:hypothetical protein